MATSSRIALVEHAFLKRSDDSGEAIPVGSPAWYAWLSISTSFTFRGAYGTFTAHKERRGPSQEYWKAYRRRGGRLHRAYLGRSDELSFDRLNEVASQLARATSGAVSYPSALAEDTIGVVPDRIADIYIREERAGALDQSQTLSQEGVIGDMAATADGAQSLHLLATKLALPPPRIRLVPRPRLVSRFETAIYQKQRLLLVAAPAGFGKTTAVAEWIHSQGHRAVAWLALDDNDNQLNLFLAYLIAALETLQPRIGVEAWALLRGHAGRPPTHAILTSLLNALAKSAGEIIVALDDYHTITLPAIHEAIAFLLDHMPAHMYICITTRADPPLPLARLRARGQLAEVRAMDLRFTREEAAHLFEQVHGIALPNGAVTTLESRTEGWATGLQLAAVSLQQQDATHIATFLLEFSGSHTYVFDYLADEVFQTQSTHVRQFLVQTSILERLCGPLCAVVTGQNEAQAVLEQLDRANLFLMPLDTSRRWYRYHPLFRDFLHEHLERSVEAGDRALLYRRASAWFEQQGLVGEAIDYALQAKAWNDALRCLTPLTASERLYEYYLDWPRWLAALPDAVLQQVPDLCLRLACILTLTGHAEAAERPLNLVEAVWLAANNQAKVGEVLSWRAAAFYWRRNHLRAIDAAQQALARLPAQAAEQRGIPTIILGMSDLDLGHLTSAMDSLMVAHEIFQHSSEPFYAHTAAFALARAYQLQGQLQRAAGLYLDLIQRAGGATHMEHPAVYFYLGRLYYEWNDLASAEQALLEGIAAGQRTGRGRYWPSAYAALAWVRWACGDGAPLASLLAQALASAQLLDSPPAIAEIEIRQAGLWLAQGDLAAAARWLATRGINTDGHVPYDRQAEYLVLARIQIAQQRQAPGSVDMDAIVRLLNRLLQAAEADERMTDRIALLALLALSHAAERDPHQAQALLATALTLGQLEGYIRTFVDEGAPMRSLLIAQRAQLPRTESGKRLQAYVDRLLDAFPHDVPTATTTSTSSELLSEREQVVLQLLAAGRSIQEIANQLIVSSNTVRAHVKHIYSKLDAHNRVQALECARNLKLL